MNHTIIFISQIILGILLTGLILLQSKGAGLSGTLSGHLGTYSTKRGVEKVVFKATVIIAILFFISALIGVIAG